jgi:hypothetical protein
MDRLTKFETLVLQSKVNLAIYRNPAEGGFTFCDPSPSSEEPLGLTGLVGIKLQFAFAVELTDSELSAIRASLLRLFERALIRVESSFTGVSEDLLQKLHILPQISTEEN